MVPSLVSVTYLLMVRTFFEGIPDSLEESAKLDGCGYFQTYLRIMLPLSKPVIAVVGLYTAVNHWNDWFAGAFYMNNSDMWPVQTVLQNMLTKSMSQQQQITSVAQALAHNAASTTTDSSENGSSGCYHSSDPLRIPLRTEIFRAGSHDRSSQRMTSEYIILKRY